jgi:hypothetical protein
MEYRDLLEPSLDTCDYFVDLDIHTGGDHRPDRKGGFLGRRGCFSMRPHIIRVRLFSEVSDMNTPKVSTALC